MSDTSWTPEFSRWRHGGWYVNNVRYPNGACGCVSRNYADKKWRIACDPRPFAEQPTFPTRDAAARAERELAEGPAEFESFHCPECDREYPGKPTPGCYACNGQTAPPKHAKARIIVVVEGGLVQNVAGSAAIEYDVLDHDWFENCASPNGPVNSWAHAAGCEDHTSADWERYLALCREADALDNVQA